MTSTAPETGRPAGQECAPDTWPRVLGELAGRRPGRLLVVLAGVHGNEPSGLYAAQRVLRRLEPMQDELRGRFVVLSGNRPALARGVRYVDRDLNRIWTADELAALHASVPEDDDVERAELRELLHEIERVLAAADDRAEPAAFLDLHSTSGDGPPFVILGDTVQNRRLAFALGVPMILGLEERITGPLLGLYADRGYAALGLEGGRHDLDSTIDRHESAIWVTLASSGLLRRNDVPDFDAHRARLRGAASGLPAIVEVTHRHGLEEGEEFHMAPGYVNFQWVRRGQFLAESSRENHAIPSPRAGYLLLPRYQGVGLDGFYLGRRVRPFWLHLSSFIRRLRLSRFAAWLPGVAYHHGTSETLVVDVRIARWLALQIFHLLGYRRCEREGDTLVFRRRFEAPREADAALAAAAAARERRAS